MKYFIDTEFIEGTQRTLFGHTKPTIDLISIGIVAEDGREYYAISKDFNLKEAWNRFQEDINPDYKPSFGGGKDGHYNPQFLRTYWLRDNVLEPIFKELVKKDLEYYKEMYKRINTWSTDANPKYHKFTYKNFKRLVNTYGKTNKQIAEEVYNFCSNDYHKGNNISFKERTQYELYDKFKPEFYGYYSDYDWVVFCWLFGKMIDLPRGFPMYCIDLKQILNDKVNKLHRNDFFTAFDFTGKDNTDISLEDKLVHITKHVSYPKQTNEHNARSDAKWNKQLYEFLNIL